MSATIVGLATFVPVVAIPPAEKVSPGVLGFIVVFALALATWVLIRSMVGHMRKVRYSPDPAAEDATKPADDDHPAGSVAAGGAGTEGGNGVGKGSGPAG